MVTKAKTTKTKKVTSKAPAKKPAAKKAAPKKNLELADLDRKGLAARARQLKTELLAIRFNLQAPSLRDYRIKKKELASVLGRLGSKQTSAN